ncbi:MAG: type 4a pilus biogenesis protein PilO [Gaiellaceae bacterium]
MKKNVNLQKHGLVIVVAVCGVLVLALGWLVLLGPKQKNLGDLSQQTAAVRQQIADDLSRAATARSATGAPTIKTADIYKLETAMPSITDMPDLLLELDQTAKAAGVKLQSIQPSAPAEGADGYSTVHITVSADGNFYTLTDLLYRLRTLVYVRSGSLQANGRIFTIDTVNLSPSGGSQLLATITLDTFVYGTLASADPLTATSATATTTGTTATTPAAAGPTAAGATH